MRLFSLFTNYLSLIIPSNSRFSTSLYSSRNVIELHPLQSIVNTLGKIKNLQESIDDPASCLYISSAMEFMSKISLKDLGISLLYISQLSRMQCMNIIETDNYHIAVFIIPKGKSLPYHDHPNMTVCSKVIHGNLKIKSFTPISNTNMSLRKSFTALLNDDCVKSSDDSAWYLTPSEGNIHEFVATSSCVVFDILLPPYNYPTRSCNYYKISAIKLIDSNTNNLLDGSIKNNIDKKKLVNFDYIPEYIAEKKIELPYSVEYCGIKPII